MQFKKHYIANLEYVHLRIRTILGTVDLCSVDSSVLFTIRSPFRKTALPVTSRLGPQELTLTPLLLMFSTSPFLGRIPGPISHAGRRMVGGESPPCQQ